MYFADIGAEIDPYKLTEEDNLFGGEEDTELMLNQMNNPYVEFDPRNFTAEQKLQWLGIKNEEEQDEINEK